jgi:hypothetical protein
MATSPSKMVDLNNGIWYKSISIHHEMDLKP